MSTQHIPFHGIPGFAWLYVIDTDGVARLVKQFPGDVVDFHGCPAFTIDRAEWHATGGVVAMTMAGSEFNTPHVKEGQTVTIRVEVRKL